MDQLNNTLVSSFLNGLAGSQTYSYGTAKCGFVNKLRYIGSKNYDSRYIAKLSGCILVEFLRPKTNLLLAISPDKLTLMQLVTLQRGIARADSR